MTSPAFTQITFRGRNDDGSESGATWKDVQGNDWSQLVGTNFRIRFLIDETNNRAWNNYNWTVYVSRNGGAYSAINGTYVNFADSDYYTEDDDCVSRLTGGSGSFLTDNNGMIESGGVCTNTGAANDYFELEYCLTIVAGGVNNGDLLRFRVYLTSGSALGSYTDTPVVTVIKPVALTIQDATSAVTLDNCVVQQILTPLTIQDATSAVTLDDCTVTVPLERTATLETEDLTEFDTTYADGTLVASQDYSMIEDWCLKMGAYQAYTNRGRFTISSYISSGVFRYRFYYRLDGATYGDGESSYFMDIAHSGGRMCDVGILYYTADGFHADPAYWSDSGGELQWDMTNFSLNATGLHWIEVEITRESYDGAADGTMYVWQDSLDTPVASKTGIDNFVAWGNIQYLTIGIATPASQPGISGYVYVDQITINDTGDEIGPVSTAIDLTIQDATSATSLEEPDLVPTTPLTIQDATSAVTLDEPNLVPVMDLTIQDATSAVTLDNCDAIAVVPITVEDATSASSLEEPDLEFIAVLTVEDATSSSNLEEPDLVPIATLTIEDVTSAATLEEPDLIPAAALTIEDATSASELEEPDLEFIAVLTIEDATSAATLEEPDLVPIATLTIEDATSAATLEEPDLDTILTLTIEDAVSATSLEEPDLEFIAVLTIEDATSSASLEEPDLVPVATLTIADAVSAAALDEPDLVFAAGLTIEDATSASELEEPDLVPITTLTIEDATSVAYLDICDAFPPGALTIEDVASATYLEEPDLVPTTPLTIEDVASAATLDEPDLVPVAVLTIEDIYSTSTIEELGLVPTTPLTIEDMLSAAFLDIARVGIPGAELEGVFTNIFTPEWKGGPK